MNMLEVTGIGVSAAWNVSAGQYTAEIVAPTGANSFVLDIEVSNAPDGPWFASYLTLSGSSASATPAADAGASGVKYGFARANVSALTLGGGAALRIRRVLP